MYKCFTIYLMLFISICVVVGPAYGCKYRTRVLGKGSKITQGAPGRVYSSRSPVLYYTHMKANYNPRIRRCRHRR